MKCYVLFCDLFFGNETYCILHVVMDSAVKQALLGSDSRITLSFRVIFRSWQPPDVSSRRLTRNELQSPLVASVTKLSHYE